MELEHPCQRQGDNRAILTASECEKADEHPKQPTGHLPSLVPAGKARLEGGGWLQDAVGGNLNPARFNGEERLLAGAVPDLETSGGGSSYGAG